MALYEITDQESYIHPMHDYGFGADVPAPVETTSTDVVLATPDTSEGAVDWMTYLSPIIAGVMMAMFSYGVARKFDVEKSKAQKVAVTMGGLTALGHGLSNWMFKQAEPLRQQLPGVAASVAPIPAGEPAAAPIVKG